MYVGYSVRGDSCTGSQNGRVRSVRLYLRGRHAYAKYNSGQIKIHRTGGQIPV